MTMLSAGTAWKRFEGRLRAYVRARVDPAWTDDVVSEILLRVARHHADLDSARDPMAWTLRVAANAITDHHRRRAAERRMLTRASADATVGHGTPDEPERNDALAACMVPLIRGLPAPYAEALMLTEIDGLSRAAAAQRLGLSVSGMKSRVQRGRERLRQALLDCCSVEIDRRGRVLDYERRAPGRACEDCGQQSAPAQGRDPGLALISLAPIAPGATTRRRCVCRPLPGTSASGFPASCPSSSRRTCASAALLPKR